MLRIVLAQQVLAIVIAIRRAHNRVDMVAGGFIVVVDDARLVVELDEDHGIEDAIVKGLASSSGPIQAKSVLLRWRFASW